MKAADFIKKWSDSTLRERQAAQEHFIDLCRLIGEKTPAEADPFGDSYCFERGAEKTGGGDGWADVWKKGCFAWEYKGKHKDLNAALRQVQTYALDLQNPPYLVVSDMDRIIVHTNWTNTVSKKYELSLEDLRDPANHELLRDVFAGSEKLKPKVSPQDLTATVALRFGAIGKRLQERGHDPRVVAHFLNQLVFCMFAEDARLLPADLFTRTIKATQARPVVAEKQLAALFKVMATEAEDERFFGTDLIRWFNGGLFDGAATLPLTVQDLKDIGDTADENDWSEIDPAIFGTLFEQALTATRERPALGAHYTDRDKIMKIVEPVIIRPLTAEWEGVLETIRTHRAAVSAAEAERAAVHVATAEAMRTDPAAAKAAEPQRRKTLNAIERRRDAAAGAAEDALHAFLDRLAAFRVLDPACGSGNFLYVALHALKDIELRAILDAGRLGVTEPQPRVGLDAVKGIEIEPYAAELARVTLWIGDLQWMKRHGFTIYREPILNSLPQIECRDALLSEVKGADGNTGWIPAQWPEADVIIGNPPFLGAKWMYDTLGEEKTKALRNVYAGSVPASADFVAFWLHKADRHIGERRTKRAAFVTTNMVRGPSNREIMEHIERAAGIFEAWSDEAWTLNGADVRVSMVCFGASHGQKFLNGSPVDRIYANLEAGAIDVTEAARLAENAQLTARGVETGGEFDVPGDLARDWLKSGGNPNAKPNSDVLRPLISGQDLKARTRDYWLIDFHGQSIDDASLYAPPFRHLEFAVHPTRAGNRDERVEKRWWLHRRSGADVRALLANSARVIATVLVSKHRFFRYVDTRALPDTRVVVVGRDDDVTFGVLSSRYHQMWTLALCQYHGVGNDPVYTPSTTFETFPFPEGLTPNIPATEYASDPRAIAIAAAAARLNELREAWLNPPDLVRCEPEVVPGYPDRILPKDEAAAKVLKKRTLTNLYNERPAWLAMAHKSLDDAVADAYGWPRDMSDEDVLAKLFELNQSRAKAEAESKAPAGSRKRKAGED